MVNLHGLKAAMSQTTRAGRGRYQLRYRNRIGDVVRLQWLTEADATDRAERLRARGYDAEAMPMWEGARP